jgi:hypothetical protein
MRNIAVWRLNIALCATLRSARSKQRSGTSYDNVSVG